jgi:hypothetical protein
LQQLRDVAAGGLVGSLVERQHTRLDGT